MNRRHTAIISREGDWFVALCPELDIASQGESIESVRENLREASTLFFEEVPEEEVQRRLHDEIYITQIVVPVGLGRESTRVLGR